MNKEEPAALHVFGGYGIELEYMIVDRDSLDVRPIADRLLTAARDDDQEDGIACSNELVLHVIELKNPLPSPDLRRLPAQFQVRLKHLNHGLASMNACLMPGAMHPWMDPRRETLLWPHDNQAIYRSYDRIFDCHRHGWANLQSMHVNLPFSGDAEFARLHTAVRLALPILPALAASSPLADGRPAGWADYRMHVYAENARAMPSITGAVIPESVSGRREYEQRILAPMYRDIAPLDTEHALQHEWLNSRGAIARFDRSAIEIRVIDTQECVQADLAVAAATVALVRRLYSAAPAALPTGALAAILQACMRDAGQAVIEDRSYLRLLGYSGNRCQAGELWASLLADMHDEDSAYDGDWRGPLRVILSEGTLARRILRALAGDYRRDRLREVYRALCACLDSGRMFTGLN